MKKHLLLALCAMLAISPAWGAQKTPAELTTEVQTNFRDNKTGAITPKVLRDTMQDVVDSFAPLSSLVINCASSQWVRAIGGAGSACAQPSFANIAGSIAPSQIPFAGTVSAGGVLAIAPVSGRFITSLGANGIFTQAQPAFSDISGKVAASQLPTPTDSALGGVKALTPAASNWLKSLGTNGAFTATQPAFSDLSGSLATTQLPALTGDVSSSAGSASVTVNKVQGTTPGTGVVSAFGNPINATGGFLTYGGANSAGVNYASNATASPSTQTVTDKFNRIVLATDDSRVDPTGVGDSAAGLNALLSSGNLTLRFPAGTYLVDAPLVLKSRTTVECDAGATLKAKYSFQMFLNSNANRVILVDATPPTEANQTDTDIIVHGCMIDYTSATSATDPLQAGPGGFLFYLARRVTIYNNYVLGETAGTNPARTPNATRIAGSADVKVYGNNFVGVYNGLGVWNGSERVHEFANYIWVAPSSAGSGTPYSCGNINGMGTQNGNHQTTTDVVVENNVCDTNGGTGGGTVVAWNNGTLSSGSKINNFTFRNNTTRAANSNNVCYSANGWINKNDLINNVFENCDSGSVSLTAHSTGWGSASNIIATTSGSSSVVVTIASATVTTVSVGNYLHMSGVTTVGGLTLTGYYPITAVSSGSVTIDAGANASSTATSAGSTTVTTYWGAYRNSQIVGNICRNCTSTGDAVFVVSGPGNTIRDNVVEGGTYGALVRVSSFDCCSPYAASGWIRATVSNNTGQAGTGISSPIAGLAVSGDGFLVYETSYPPFNLDTVDQVRTLTTAATFTSASYANVGSGALSSNVIAGRTYRFKFYSSMTADATGGWKLYFNGSTATMSSFMATGLAFCSSPKTLVTSQSMTAVSSAVSDSTSGCTTPMLMIDGIFTVSASGTFTPSAGEVSAVGTLTMPVGTYLSVQRLN